jgi:hypothetical protein
MYSKHCWMIYKGPGSPRRMIWLLPQTLPPLPPVRSTGDTGRLRKRDNLLTENGKEVRRRKRPVPLWIIKYSLHSVQYSNRKPSYPIEKKEQNLVLPKPNRRKYSIKLRCLWLQMVGKRISANSLLSAYYSWNTFKSTWTRSSREGWDLAESLERLALNAKVLGSIPASSDTDVMSGRWAVLTKVHQNKKYKKSPFNYFILFCWGLGLWKCGRGRNSWEKSGKGESGYIKIVNGLPQKGRYS